MTTVTIRCPHCLEPHQLFGNDCLLKDVQIEGFAEPRELPQHILDDLYDGFYSIEPEEVGA